MNPREVLNRNLAGNAVAANPPGAVDHGDITDTNGNWQIDAGAVTTAELGGDVTTAGKALLDDANAAAQRTTLGLGSAAVADAGDFATAEVFAVDTPGLVPGPSAETGTFLRDDGAWATPAGGGAETEVTTANQDITSAGWVDVTDLSFDVVDGGYYRYRAFLIYQVSTISMAIFFGVNGPTGTHRALHRKKVQVGISVDGFTEQHLNAYDTSLVTTGEPSTGECLYTIEGSFIATADGTFTVRLDKENVAGTGTVLAGSYLEHARIDS